MAVPDQAKIERFDLNLDAVEQFVSADSTTTVATPGGKNIPSLLTIIDEVRGLFNPVEYSSGQDLLGDLDNLSPGQFVVDLERPAFYQVSENESGKGLSVIIEDGLIVGSGQGGVVGQNDGTAFLESAFDSDGNVFRQVRRDGHEFLANLNDSTQNEIFKRSGLIENAHPGDDLEQCIDSENHLFRRTDNRGALYISQQGSVQHHLRTALDYSRNGFDEPIRSNRYRYKPVVKEAMRNIADEMVPFVAAPLLLVPNNFDIPDQLLNDIEISDDNPVVQLKFPYGEGGSVHPYILPLREPLYGYRYLLTDSFHKNSSQGEESPCMFGTNDFETFDLIPDLPQPMTFSAAGDPLSSYNSDPFIGYNPVDGMLLWGARETYIAGSSYTVVAGTYDGLNFTKRHKFSVSGDLSPSLLYDFNLSVWRLWAFSEGELIHSVSDNWYGPWVEQDRVNFQAEHGIRVWHGEVKYMGDRFCLCVHSRDAGTDTKAQVHLGLSADGVNWVMSNGLVKPQSGDIYKPTFFPEFSEDNKVRFTFLWSHWDWVDQTLPSDMQIYVQKSAWLDLSSY